MKGKRSKQELQEAAALIEDLTHESVEKRVAAARKVGFIAEVLGGERVKSELLPFLRKEVVNDEASVLCEMVAHVPVLHDVIGAGATGSLLPLLEDGLEYEEERVRDLITEKYYELVSHGDVKQAEKAVLESLRRLQANDYDGVKKAYCCVVARKLGHFSLPAQQELLAGYAALAEDPSPTRRRHAARYSRDLMGWVGTAEGAILKIVEALAKDKEEGNKIYLIDAVIELAKVKAPSALQSYFNLISYQFTWRVRYELISKIELLAEAMGREQFKSFLTYYIKYLNDIEPEIRSIANSKLSAILPFLELDDIMGRIMPALKNIPQDPQPYVRNALASALFHLCPVIGKRHTIDAIVPKFLLLLKDEQEPQVKQTAFKNVDLLCSTLGIDTLSQSVMPVLEEMVAHSNWRTRSEAITVLAYLIRQSPLAFMTDKINRTILEFLKDRAHSIRREGIRLICQVVERHGLPWAEKNLLAKWLPLFKSSTFLHRETALLALESFAGCCSPDYLSKSVVPLVLQLVKDPVENVRIRVCMGLGELHRHCAKDREALRKSLQGLKEDADQDVKDMAVRVASAL